MTVKAKTLIKDKFWIVEQNGEKLGTLQKKDNNGWIFLSKADKRQVYHTQESLFQRFGVGIFSHDIKIGEPGDSTVETIEGDEGTGYTVHGYPCSQKPFNPMFDVQKQLPIYTKTPKSKNVGVSTVRDLKLKEAIRRPYYKNMIVTMSKPFKWINWHSH